MDRRILPLVNYLKYFTPLDRNQLIRIEAAVQFISVNRNQWLLQEGDYSDGLYFLNSGMIRTVSGNEESEVTVWVTLPHHFVTSAYSYIKKQPSYVSLQAISRSELLWISRGQIKQLYQQVPVLNEISLAIMNEYYIDLERLYIFCLAHSAQQRYIDLLTYFPEHFIRVPLKYLASMIHVKPETLSRIRRRWQDNRNTFVPDTG